MKHLKLFFALFAMLALGVSNAWGAEKTITLTYSDFGLTNSYAQKTATVDGIGFTVNQDYKGSGNVIQMNSSKGAGVLFNTTSIAGLKSITVNVSSGSKTYTITSGTAQTPLGNSQTGTATKTFSIPSGDTYFQLKVSGASYFSSIVITYDDSNSGGETPGTGGETPGTGGGSANVTYDFTKIDGFSSWPTSYASGKGDVVYTEATVKFTGAVKQTQTITDCPVTKGGQVQLVLNEAYADRDITNITFVCRQWGTKSQTITLHYSTDKGVSYTTTEITSTNFTISSAELPEGTNAVKITFSSSSNQVGIESVTFSLSSSEGSSGGETPEPETPATELTNDQFAWSAATAEATMGASNTFPTLTNTLPVSVTYESSTPATATIDATSGAITLVAPGTTTISAKFAGGEVSGTTYAAKTVKYDLTVLKAPATPTENVYVKVTETAGITDGDYLIVYEDAEGNPKAPVAFDGSLAPVKLDVASNNIEVSIASNTIAGNTDIDAATFTINTTAGTIQTKDGYYIGQTSNANGLATSTTTEYTNTISIENDGSATIISSGGAYLRYNSANDNLRFRYFKSSTYTAQKAVALYKKASKHTVTIADCTNGSVSANVANGAQVLSGTAITLTPNAETGYKLSAYDVYKTGDNTTKVTVDGNTFIMPEFDVTISATFELAKTLTGIEITTTDVQKTFWQGETFNSTGLKVTAHFDGAADEDVTDKVTITGNTATSGTQTVTVSFKEGEITKDATYTITVNAIPNTKETAYTVADAFDIIDKLTTAEGVFISGIISQVDSYNEAYKSITYWISDDGTTTKQLQAYSGKGLEGAEFVDINGVSVEDQVIVCGDLKKHTDGTYEFNYNNYLVSQIKTTKADPELSYTTTEYNVNLGDAFTAPTLNNPNSLDVTYSSNNEDVATVAADGAVTIKAAGTVVITASFAGNEDYVAGEASYTINVTDPSISEATFVAGTDKSEELSISKNGVTVEFTGGTFSRDDNYRCYAKQSMTISYNDGQITKIVLVKSSDNSKTPSNFTTEQGTYAYAGSEGVWTGEAKSVTFETTTQVQMNTITVYYKQDTRTAAGLEWSPEAINLTIGDAFTAPTFSNPNSLNVNFDSDNTTLATVSNTGVISLNAGVTGTAVITASYEGDATYKDAAVTCTITVNPKTETVVILAQYNGQWYALKNVEETAGKVLAALPVNYVGGKLYNVEEADKATIEWQRAAVTDGIIFKNGENYISGTAGDTDLKLSTTECAWTLDGTTYKLGNRTFFYNETANGFKNYNTSNAGNSGYSNLPVVTAPVYGTGTITPMENLTPQMYGTICLENNVVGYEGITFYEVAGKEDNKVIFDEVTELVAGMPYIYIADSETATIVKGNETAAEAGYHKSLQGTFTQIDPAESNILTGNYILYNNVIKKCGKNCGLKDHKAYFIASGLEGLSAPQAQMPGRRRVSLNTTGENAATGIGDVVVPTEQATKTIINGQLIIIRDGEKFNAQGQKL